MPTDLTALLDAMQARCEAAMCRACRGQGKILAYRPTIYITDSDDEVADSVEMAMRPCPECAKRKADLPRAIAALRVAVKALEKVSASIEEARKEDLTTCDTLKACVIWECAAREAKTDTDETLTAIREALGGK